MKFRGRATYQYDEADRLVAVTDAAAHLTAYGYDTENNLVNITDALNRATGFAYDSMGRVTQVTFPSGSSESYTYDAVNNLLSKTDRKGQTINYTYDFLNRLTSKAYPNSTAVNYTYDLDSRLTQVSDPTGTYLFGYDNLGRLIGSNTQYSFLGGQTLTNAYTYDANSNRLSLTNPQGGVTTYTYDSLNRMTGITDFAGRTFGFSYDQLGRRTSLTRPNGVNTSYSYDALSRLLSVLHQVGSTVLDGAAYTYDAAGNRTSKTALPGNVTSAYSYDPIYQLTQVMQGTTRKESYTYDAVGNRTYQPGVPYTYHSSNEMLTREGVPYTYDANGNRLSKTDGSGTTSYTWDYENRLTSLTVPGTGTVSFAYDPFGRRIENVSPSGTTIYVYDGDNITEELGANGSLASGERYTYGPGVDEPLVGQRQPKIFFYEADGLGSVTSLTDPTGAVAATYTYDSFGFMTASTGSATNWFRYTGRQFDSTGGLYYYRARYYDPMSGRFLSEDPFRFTAGVNFYRYVRNNPADLADPLGLCDSEKCSEALKGGGQDMSAVQRAMADWDMIEQAALANGVDPTILAAIGIRETGFQNIPQAGHGMYDAGMGIFQIDAGQFPNATSIAYDPAQAASFAAGLLGGYYRSNVFGGMNPVMALDAAIRSYNRGPNGLTPVLAATGWPPYLDVGTARGNYVTDVAAIAAYCF